MKIATHDIATGVVTVRDATGNEAAAIEAGYARPLVPSLEDLERAALAAINRNLLDAELAKPVSDIPEVEALRAAQGR